MNGVNLISAGVTAGLLVLFYFCRDAKKIGEKAKNIVGDKTKIIQMDLMKTVWLITATVTGRAFQKVQKDSKISTKGISEKVSEAIDLVFKPREEIEKMISKMEVSQEDMPLLKIEEEDQHRIFGLSVIIANLEKIPQKFSNITDQMIKAIIAGIGSIILMGIGEYYTLSGAYLSLLNTLILFALLVYLWGVLNIWWLRVNEKRLEELDNAKTLSDIETVVKWG